MKLINTAPWATGHYSEEGQNNPIRWQNLKHIEGDVFEPVTRKWRCKDFMNEVVTSWWLNRRFYIYGFLVEPTTFFNREWEGLPLMLTGILPGWKANMEVVNNYVLDQGFPPVYYKSTEYGMFINIPEEYMSNTLFMSQITLFIRLANTYQNYKTLADMSIDVNNQGDVSNLQACFAKPLGQFSPKLEKYIWYYNAMNNLPRDYPAEQNIQTSMMHNCGVCAWGWIKEEETV